VNKDIQKTREHCVVKRWKGHVSLAGSASSTTDE